MEAVVSAKNLVKTYEIGDQSFNALDGISPANMGELFFGFFAKMHEKDSSLRELQGEFIRFILLYKEGNISEPNDKKFRTALKQFMQSVKKINDSSV